MSWSSKEVGTLCSQVYSGGTPTSSNEAYYGGDIPWLRTQEVTFNRIKDTEIKITEAGLNSSSAKWFPANSVIVAMYGNSAGRVAINEIPLTTNQACCNLVIDPKLADYRHVFYALKNSYEALKGQSRGAAQNNLNAAQVKAFKIPCPPLAVQNAIGDILSAYDDLIENNRRRIQLLEQSARLLYKEWFVHLRFPGHEHVKIVDGVPEGWRKVPLQEVCKRITDGSHSSPRSVDEGLPMASVKNMHDWGFNTEQCRNISQQDFELLVRNDCKPLKNDVLIAKDGSYLKHTFVVQEEIDLVILSSIAILRPNHFIDPHLLNFILRDPRTKMRMTGYVSGVALPRIILKEFRGFEILLPPVEVQHLWSIHAHPIAVQCHQLGKQNEALTQARDLLLPRLMNGEVAV